MKFGRVAKESSIIDISKELHKIPKRLINIVEEAGVEIFCFNETFTPKWIGLPTSNVKDGRSTNNTSCFLPSHKILSIFEGDMKNNELAFSTILHEFGHALDFVLAEKENGAKYWWLSDNDNIILEGWKNGKALDWYADTSPQEYFAQGFMAYCEQGNPRYKPTSYRAHTREELKEKDPNLYYYIKSLCEKQ